MDDRAAVGSLEKLIQCVGGPPSIDCPRLALSF
jgi:hypothetical protein